MILPPYLSTNIALSPPLTQSQCLTFCRCSWEHSCRYIIAKDVIFIALLVFPYTYYYHLHHHHHHHYHFPMIIYPLFIVIHIDKTYVKNLVICQRCKERPLFLQNFCWNNSSADVYTQVMWNKNGWNPSSKLFLSHTTTFPFAVVSIQEDELRFDDMLSCLKFIIFALILVL